MVDASGRAALVEVNGGGFDARPLLLCVYTGIYTLLDHSNSYQTVRLSDCSCLLFRSRRLWNQLLESVSLYFTSHSRACPEPLCARESRHRERDHVRGVTGGVHSARGGRPPRAGAPSAGEAGTHRTRVGRLARVRVSEKQQYWRDVMRVSE